MSRILHHRFLSPGLLLILLGLTSPIFANVTLPPLFSDHLVLQRSSHTAVWGKADPNEKVTVTLDAAHSEATADNAGKWKVELDLSSVKEGPFEMQVTGNNTIKVADVLVGEVWLCSGQSNMAYTLNRGIGGAEEVAKADNSRLREFRVDMKYSSDPLAECHGSWIVCTPATASNFSAVGYYFAKNIQAKMNTPVAIVLSAWAGTVATAWISKDSTDAEPDLKAIADRGLQQETEYPGKKAAFVPAMMAWETENHRQDHPCDPAPFNGPKVTESDWKTVLLPGHAQDLGLPDSGTIWYRRAITLDEVKPGVPMSIDVGGPHDFNAVYWNGQKIGGMDEASAGGKIDTKRYPVPAAASHKGENILAIRIYTPTEKGGFSTAPFLDVGPVRTLVADKWLAKSEYELPALTEEARKDLPQVPGAPDSRSVSSRLFNGMIAPLVPQTLAGVIWYQGEQDTGRSRAQYGKMLDTLITDWRAKWSSDLPFVICQLPNNGEKIDAPGESRWAEIRQAQLEALKLPKTVEPVLIDLGEKDVHPPNKKPVGERVALAALGAFYGQKGVYSGPIVDTVKVDASKLVISFKSVGDGLVAKPLPADYQPTFLSPELKPLTRHSPGSDLEGFSICGEDNKWVWADAKIVGNTVVVSSPSVAQPTKVRYAWADNPTCNLYNSADLPASPFEASVAP